MPRSRTVVIFMVSLLLLLSSASALPIEQISAPKGTTTAAYSDDSTFFGGIYYEGDTMIINLVGPSTNTVQSIAGTSNVEYRYVSYSLSFLEHVKDELAKHMADWNIIVLDANETTNTVDVSLREMQYAQEIRSYVENNFKTADFLHFIDLGNNSIQLTVGRIDEID